MSNKKLSSVYIESNGCAVLRHDTQRISRYFRLNGFIEIDDPMSADFILMTSCGVTKFEEDRAISSIKSLENGAKQDAKVIFGGCLPQINKPRVSAEVKGTVIGRYDEKTLDEIIGAEIPLEQVFWDGLDLQREHSLGLPSDLTLDINNSPEYLKAKHLSDKYEDSRFIEIYNYLTEGKYFWKEEGLFEVSIANGCKYNCGFCGTKSAIGDLNSKDLSQVLEEFKYGLSKGKFSKFLLIGDEIGDYKDSNGNNIVDLMNNVKPLIDERKGSKVAIRYIFPTALVRNINGLMPFFESGDAYYLCCSIQTPSEDVLRNMRRPKTLDKLREILARIEEANPLVYKHTQLIVGYPGETETNFRETLDFISEGHFDFHGITRYSDRPGTLSFDLSGKIAQEEIEERYDRTQGVIQNVRLDKIEAKNNYVLTKHL